MVEDERSTEEGACHAQLSHRCYLCCTLITGSDIHVMLALRRWSARQVVVVADKQREGIGRMGECLGEGDITPSTGRMGVYQRGMGCGLPLCLCPIWLLPG